MLGICFLGYNGVNCHLLEDNVRTSFRYFMLRYLALHINIFSRQCTKHVYLYIQQKMTIQLNNLKYLYTYKLHINLKLIYIYNKHIYLRIELYIYTYTKYPNKIKPPSFFTVIGHETRPREQNKNIKKDYIEMHKILRGISHSLPHLIRKKINL